MKNAASGLALALLLVVSSRIATAQLKDARLDDYEQWRLSLKPGAVADPASITVPAGFKVELVRVARPDEGSWISLVFDPRGRLVVGREDKGLLRMSLADDRRSISRVETINDDLLECRGLLFAYDSLFVHANNSKGLYRLRDTDGDDRFDQVQLLRRTEGGVGHGRNGLALGPDGMIYLALGNNVQVPADRDPASPYRNYAIDRLLPCVWNEFLFDSDVVPPAGHIVRTDPDGKHWELFAGGFRNPYGIAFNGDGELFTYDADMEWDAGAPWYRPTCVMHVVSGGEYGWRQETNCWPDHYADSLPRVVDVGLGSPTGVKFGEGSGFPGKYNRALYILDWAYGRIIAVHLKPRGATYTGQAETFLKGRPLNVTDLAFGPDGAMYFVVGGRRTQSTLYRVSYTADRTAEWLPLVDRAAAEARAQRRFLGRYDHPAALSRIFESLASRDRWIAYSACVALERLSVREWQEQALSESDPVAAAHALIALARVGEAGARVRINARVLELLAAAPALPERLALWRAVQLSIIRLGRPAADQTRELVSALSDCYDSPSGAERQIVCELLVALDAPDVIAKTLERLDAAPAQEEQLFYIFALRNIERGWGLAQRERYFRWLKRSESFAGAHYLHRFLTFIRTDALATLSEQERTQMQPLIDSLGKAPQPSGGPSSPRAEVRKWSLDDLSEPGQENAGKRDLERGKRVFAEALCIRCHRLQGAGQPIGPDLDGVSSRFGRRDLLESILLPSKAVDEKYRSLIIETDTGGVVTGQLAGGDSAQLAIATDPLEPARIVRVPRKSIVSRRTSPVSLMPEGLLNTFDREEILDLLAYLEAR